MALLEGFSLELPSPLNLLSTMVGMKTGDVRITAQGGRIYPMQYDASSAATATILAHPYVVTPAAGGGRWVEQLPSQVEGEVAEEDTDYPIFEMKDTTGDTIAQLTVSASDLTADTQDGSMSLWVMVAGTLTKFLTMDGAGVITLDVALPTSDPSAAGQLYTSTGAVTVSAG